MANASPRWLIPALSITLVTSYGSLYYAIAVLSRPIQAELGWTGDITVGAYSLALLIAGLSAYVVGKIIDERGGHLLMTWGSVIAGALLVALSQIHSLVAYYAIWAGIGVAMAMTQYEAAFAIVVAKYPHAYRNRIGILTLAGGLSSTVFWPLTHALVESIGWRGATMALGLFTLAVCVPLHWYTLPRTAPREHKASTVSPELPEHLTPGLRKLVRTPVFWLLALCFTAFAFVNAAMALHAIPILESRGLEAVAAVSLAALVGPMQVTSRFTDVVFNDRVPALLLGAVTVLLIPLGLTMLLPASTASPLLYVFVVIYGAGLGLITITRATTITEFFGRQRYGSISGLLSAPSAVSRAIGPVTAAAILTAFHDYSMLLTVLIAVGTSGAVCYWAAVIIHRRKR